MKDLKGMVVIFIIISLILGFTSSTLWADEKKDGMMRGKGMMMHQMMMHDMMQMMHDMMGMMKETAKEEEGKKKLDAMINRMEEILKKHQEMMDMMKQRRSPGGKKDDSMEKGSH